MQHGFYSSRVLKHYPSAILRGNEPSVGCHALFTLLHSLKNNLEFCQWPSRADRVLTLNMNCDDEHRLALFWSTWIQARPAARGLNWLHVLA